MIIINNRTQIEQLADVQRTESILTIVDESDAKNGRVVHQLVVNIVGTACGSRLTAIRRVAVYVDSPLVVDAQSGASSPEPPSSRPYSPGTIEYRVDRLGICRIHIVW